MKKTDKKMRINRFFKIHYPKFKDDFKTEALPKHKPHFIKIEIGDKTFDYYPGKQRIKLCRGNESEDWKDCKIKDLLISLGERSGKSYFSNRIKYESPF